MTHTRTNKAFSIIELLVAMIILGILVAIIVPVLASRTEQARLRKAEADLERIQNALETASIDTGYYYRIHVLDDGPGGDGGDGNLLHAVDEGAPIDFPVDEQVVGVNRFTRDFLVRRHL